MPALSKKHFDLQATLSLREECKTQVLENSAVNKKWAWAAEFTVTRLCRRLALQSEGLFICNLQTCAYIQLLIKQKKNNSMQCWLVKKCAEGCYMSLNVICILDIGGRWMSITVQQLACVQLIHPSYHSLRGDGGTCWFWGNNHRFFHTLGLRIYVFYAVFLTRVVGDSWLFVLLLHALLGWKMSKNTSKTILHCLFLYICCLWWQ